MSLEKRPHCPYTTIERCSKALAAALGKYTTAMFAYLEGLPGADVNPIVIRHTDHLKRFRLAPEVTLDRANQEIVAILAAIEDHKKVADQDQEIDFKTLNLKKFNGGRARGLQKWEAWWPSYNDLVHKRSGASSINKLDFLKSKMDGDAATLIASVPMTSEGYNQAIQRLQRAFGNREFATWNFTWDLLDIPAAKEESAETLTKLFSSFQLALNGLRHHGAEVNNYAVTALMMYALPDKTYKEYTKEETRRDHPDWVSDADGLLAWLEQRYNKFRQVQPRDNATADKSKKAKGAAAATTTAGGDVPPAQAATTAAAPAAAGAVPKQPKKKAKAAGTGPGKPTSKSTTGGADKAKKEKILCPFCGLSGHNPSKCPDLERDVDPGPVGEDQSSEGLLPVYGRNPYGQGL